MKPTVKKLLLNAVSNISIDPMIWFHKIWHKKVVINHKTRFFWRLSDESNKIQYKRLT